MKTSFKVGDFMWDTFRMNYVFIRDFAGANCQVQSIDNNESQHFYACHITDLVPPSKNYVLAGWNMAQRNLAYFEKIAKHAGIILTNSKFEKPTTAREAYENFCKNTHQRANWFHLGEGRQANWLLLVCS